MYINMYFNLIIFFIKIKKKNRKLKIKEKKLFIIE